MCIYPQPTIVGNRSNQTRRPPHWRLDMGGGLAIELIDNLLGRLSHGEKRSKLLIRYLL